MSKQLRLATAKAKDPNFVINASGFNVQVPSQHSARHQSLIIMSNFMAFGIVTVQSCTLGVPKSGAWECLVKAFHLVSNCSPLKPSRDDAEHTSNAVSRLHLFILL